MADVVLRGMNKVGDTRIEFLLDDWGASVEVAMMAGSYETEVEMRDALYAALDGLRRQGGG